MPNIGIVAEYNPFHNGHKYQIDKIREEFGQDTNIIVVMSGNFTQRGESAIYDKFTRARAAAECGVDLVLELPLPFSSSSAEFFAKGAVHILDSIKCVDYISFGSESGDISSITRTALAMATPEYTESLNALYTNPEYSKVGYPKLCEIALSSVMGDSEYVNLTPNNILALEYVKALYSCHSKMQPHTVLRSGARYDSDFEPETPLQSASYIRKLILHDAKSASDYIPKSAFNTFCEADIYNYNLLSLPLIYTLRSSESYEALSNVFDLDEGLFHRIRSAAFRSNNLEDLITIATTKKYTSARIRRVLLNILLNIRIEHMKRLPEYSQVLAIGERGRSILKAIKKASDFPIITKPSNVDNLSETTLSQKRFSDMADSIFHLTANEYIDGHHSIRATPYVVQSE